MTPTVPFRPRKVGLLTSGDEAPGMNAAIRAATKLLVAEGCEVLGVRQGYRGLIVGAFTPLYPPMVQGIYRDGGTMLGAGRCPEFHERAGRDRARAQMRDAQMDELIVIGGDGTIAGAAALTDMMELGGLDLRVVCVPASIDNDIGLTGMSVGVDTAMNTIVEACDRISDTATQSSRTYIVEVMGRECGYLAMTSGIAAAADAVLFPESGRSGEDLIEGVTRAVARARRRSGDARRVLIITAEGTDLSVDQLRDSIEERLAHELQGEEDPVETRVTVLGHIVRGGRPSAYDRLLANRLAHVAVRALLDGETRKMAAWMLPTDLAETMARRSDADPYCWLVDIEAVVAECRRLREGTSDLVRWRRQVFAGIEDVLSS
jgi:6-phosphofructokinase 1